MASTLVFLGLLLIWDDLEGRASGNGREVPETRHSLFVDSATSHGSCHLAICLHVLAGYIVAVSKFHLLLEALKNPDCLYILKEEQIH